MENIQNKLFLFKIALDFHEKRNASPRRYANRLFNKLAYGCISWYVFLFSFKYPYYDFS
jgi:hypothetical protein